MVVTRAVGAGGSDDDRNTPPPKKELPPPLIKPKPKALPVTIAPESVIQKPSEARRVMEQKLVGSQPHDPDVIQPRVPTLLGGGAGGRR
jgi:hypothetical protein